MPVLQSWRIWRGCLTLLAASTIALAIAATSSAAEPPVSYTRDIQPLLADRCFVCHGPDEQHRQADLRLDVRAAVVGVAIEPGQPEASELWSRLTSNDPDLAMPPPDSKKKPLSAAEKELVRRWIAAGAEYDSHWAYRPLVRPEPPTPRDAAGAASPIDAFVRARLAAEGLQPTAEADRRTLLRRLSFDLTGLPPTAAEVEEFAADRRPDAHQRAVDRLLTSERFGERMAIYWLDLVRYADTDGIHGDQHRDIAPYRDYVIRAFNTNKPFDQFTIEQLAGDLLPDGSNEQKIASGYNRLLMTTREGGAQAKEYLAKYSADRVRNASSVWMGATMGCAECHTHKYDPYTLHDFYRFAAFFADVQEVAVGAQPQVKLPTPRQEGELAEIAAQLAPLRQEYERPRPELAAAQRAWEERTLRELDTNAQTWAPLRPTALASAGGQTLTIRDDLSVLAAGANPNHDTYTLTLPLAGRARLAAVRLETLTDPTLAGGGLSRANGNFVLTGVELELVAGDQPPQPLKIGAAVADFAQANFPVEHAFDGQPNTGWAVEGHVKKANRTAVFRLAEPVDTPADARLIVRLKHESPHTRHNIGCFRLAATDVADAGLDDAGRFTPEFVAALRTPAAERTAEQLEMLAGEYRGQAPELTPLRTKIAALESRRQAIEAAFPETLITRAANPRPIRVLPRGNWLDDSGELVEPAIPVFLGSLAVEGRRANRLDLAQWLASRDNPLVARVYVNRLWKLMFGRGLSRSLDDFGAQGEPPSHPELLDWLAVELIESGWSTKHVLKTIAMSATYRQDSTPTPELRERDPYNRLLARQGRFRIDAEMVRDQALDVSGLLVEQVGGPSVKPYQPAGYWVHLNFPRREWQHDTGAAQYRRGVYTYWCRTFLHPSLVAFDAPTREECTAGRLQSNTPQQALVLLNDPTYVEAARALAARVLEEAAANDDARLREAIRRVLARPPRAGELDALAAVLAQQRAEYGENPAAARQLLAVGLSPAPAAFDPAELASWTAVCRVLLNLHETITRY